MMTTTQNIHSQNCRIQIQIFCRCCHDLDYIIVAACISLYNFFLLLCHFRHYNFCCFSSFCLSSEHTSRTQFSRLWHEATQCRNIQFIFFKVKKHACRNCITRIVFGWLKPRTKRKGEKVRRRKWWRIRRSQRENELECFCIGRNTYQTV